MNVENSLPETFEKIINKSTKLKSTEKILVEEVKNKMSKIIITQLFRTEKWRRHSYNSFSPKIPLILKDTKEKFATVYKGNIIKNLIMDCRSYT